MPETIESFQSFDIELEQSVLGSMLVEAAFLRSIGDLLDAEHFYDPLHARLYDALLALESEGPVDPLILHSVMKSDPGLIEVGGLGYLANLAGAAPAMPANLISSMARVLRDLSDRRGLAELGRDLVEGANKPPNEEPTLALADKIAERIWQTVAKTPRGRRRQATRVGDAALALGRKIEDRYGSDAPSCALWLPALQEALGGLFPGKLYFVGGRPGMGKSLFATGVARTAAALGWPVDYYSGEMDDDELAARLVCDQEYESAIETGRKPLAYRDFVQMRASALLERFTLAQIELSSFASIDLFCPGGMELEWLDSSCRRRHRETKGARRLVIIDHVQHVHFGGLRRGGNRAEEMTKITRALKDIAADLGWPVVAISQITRGAEDRDDPRPQMADFRDSGSIEQDADGMIGVYRPWRDLAIKARAARNKARASEKPVDEIAAGEAESRRDSSENVIELGVIKNRYGPEADYVRAYVRPESSVIRESEPPDPLTQLL